MYHKGQTVKVQFSEVKGFGAEHVGAVGKVVKVEPLRELVAMYTVKFPDGKWQYFHRELVKV